MMISAASQSGTVSAMSTQIAVRLPDDLVAFIDELVASGEVPSRADVVRRALQREQRRRIAERDLEIILRTGPDPDLAAFSAQAAKTPLDID